MRKRVKLTESQLYNVIKESVKRILRESRTYIDDAVYIVFDGTSYYPVYGIDVEDEIRDNDVEVECGPFAKWNNEVEDKVNDLNAEAQGRAYDRRYHGYY